MDIERRYYTSELRATEEGVIEGYAAVFNELSADLGGFREFIRPGAFARAVSEDDVRALWNHDSNYVLGRNKSGTLELREDDHGLRIRVTPPDAQWARDLRESIRRGDVDQMSFAFQVVEDRWEGQGRDMRRELVEVRLYDVSPVTYPAYTGTTVSARALAMCEQRNQAGDAAEDTGAGVAAGAAEQERELEARRASLRRRLALRRKKYNMGIER